MGEHAERLSVLVVSFNVRDLLCRCLASLDAADEVIVVDNASTDGSVDLVRERFGGVTLLVNEANLGFSAAVNRAAAEAKGDALLLLNPDAVVEPDTIDRMRGALDRHRNADVLGFRQVDSRRRFQLAVGPPAFLTLDLVRRAVQRRLDAGDDWIAALLDRLLFRAMSVPWVAGSSLLVRREAFDRIGGFDDRFFLFFEDIDFCLRIGAAGGRIVYDPNVTVVHDRGSSASRHRGVAEAAYRDSQLYFWDKHRGAWARRIVAAYQRLQGLSV